MRFSPASTRLGSLVVGGAGMAYPFLVLVGLRLLSAEALLVLPALLLAARLTFARRGPTDLVLGAATLAVGGLTLVSPTLALRAWPVVVNLGFAVLFLSSFVWPPVMVERFARVVHPDLPDTARPYLRRATGAWVAFFLANASVALWTVVYGTLEQWVLWNGCLGYLAMAAMFTGEYVVRRLVRPA